MEKNYIDYDAIDFAEDPSFIRWVRHQHPESAHFWESWQKKHSEKSTLIREARVLVQAIDIKETEPSQARLDGLWAKIDTATPVATAKASSKAAPVKMVVEREEKSRHISPMRWLGYAAAACVAALLFFNIYNPTTTVQVGKGEHLAYQLPDQSIIDLNADSKIVFKEKNWSQERVVELEGEAFFEVQKGLSFKVITPNGEVEVLGTSFNVNARNGGLVVDCQTGKVKVTAKGDSEILTPNKGTRLNAAGTELVDTYESDLAKQMGWRTGQFHFDNASLKEVVQELERQYDVTIQADSDLLEKVGSYDFEGSLEEALKDVTYQLGVEPVINGKKVEIRKR